MFTSRILTTCVRRYKYQLKAFVDRVRVRIPDTWYQAQDSIIAMEWVEAIYEEVSRRFFFCRWVLS